MALLTGISGEAFAPTGAAGTLEAAQLTNPFAGLLSFANRRRQDASIDQYLEALAGQNALEAMLQTQRNARELIVGTRDRDPLAARNAEAFLSGTMPDMFPGLTDADMSLLAQEAGGMAAKPGAAAFRDIGAGLASSADAGLMYPYGPTAYELSGLNMQPAYDVSQTPGGRARTGAGGGIKVRATFGMMGPDGRQYTAVITAPSIEAAQAEAARRDPRFSLQGWGMAGGDGGAAVPPPTGTPEAPVDTATPDGASVEPDAAQSAEMMDLEAAFPDSNPRVEMLGGIPTITYDNPYSGTREPWLPE